MYCLNFSFNDNFWNVLIFYKYKCKLFNIKYYNRFIRGKCICMYILIEIIFYFIGENSNIEKVCIMGIL